MSEASVFEPGIAYELCAKCSHRRPPSKLKAGEFPNERVCEDQTLCAALKARTPANPPDALRPFGPPDWDRIPDPPLVRTTQFHRTKSGELAAVTAYTNGKSNVGGNGHG